VTRLVLVDDDDVLRPVLAGNLSQAGYKVAQFADPGAALTALTGPEKTADLLVLDWKMPGMSGLDLLKALRARDITTPALFFTSHNDTLYEEAALSCGAVDFIDKTRSFTILAKRIELILARPTQDRPPADMLQLGALILDTASHTVHWRGRKVDLTFGEFRVVELLARTGRDVTYRELYDALRGENFVAGEGPDGYRANVRAMIKRIREKFAEVDSGFAAIANYPGFGYRWIGGDG
jgi:two-component system, OmpR family, response regulator ChvI